MRKVSIIIPVIRPEGAQRCIEAIKAHAPVGSYEIVTDQDVDGIGCPKMVDRLTSRARYDLIMFLGDDTVPKEGFLTEAVVAMDALPDGWGVVGLNSDGNESAHWLSHKNMAKYMGGALSPTEYKHCFCDNELRDVATEMGRWTYAEKSVIEHLHPVNHTAKWDDGYETAYKKETWAHDYRTYLRRKIDRNRKNHGVVLGVCLPLTDLQVYSHFMFSFLRIEWPEAKHLLMPNYPGNIDAVRNDLALQALHMGCTHTLMMDTDQIYHDPGMVNKMLGHDKPVVGARVHKRYPPFEPLLLRGKVGGIGKEGLQRVPDAEIIAAKNNGGLVEVDATGCGCIMYDTRIFIDIERPWFETIKAPEGHTIGEDIGFCGKLRGRGIPIFVDASIDIGHLAIMEVDWAKYQLFKKLTVKGVRHGKRE